MEETRVLPRPPPAHKHTHLRARARSMSDIWLNKGWTESGCYMVMNEAAPLTPTRPPLEHLVWTNTFNNSNVRRALLKADLACAPVLTVWTWTWLHKSSSSTLIILKKTNKKRRQRPGNDAKLMKLFQSWADAASITVPLQHSDHLLLLFSESFEFWCHIFVMKCLFFCSIANPDQSAELVFSSSCLDTQDRTRITPRPTKIV